MTPSPTRAFLWLGVFYSFIPRNKLRLRVCSHLANAKAKVTAIFAGEMDFQTRMYSSRTRTVRCSSHLLGGEGMTACQGGLPVVGGSAQGVFAQEVSTCQGCLPASGGSGCLPGGVFTPPVDNIAWGLTIINFVAISVAQPHCSLYLNNPKYQTTSLPATDNVARSFPLHLWRINVKNTVLPQNYRSVMKNSLFVTSFTFDLDLH